MKRDLELIRQILLALEAKTDNGILGPQSMHLPGDWIEPEINYNLRLLIDSDLVIGSVDYYDNYPQPMVTRLTWSGHDFLDAARDETRWKKALAIGAKVGGIAFELLKPLLMDLARESIQKAF